MIGGRVGMRWGWDWDRDIGRWSPQPTDLLWDLTLRGLIFLLVGEKILCPSLIRGGYLDYYLDITPFILDLIEKPNYYATFAQLGYCSR